MKKTKKNVKINFANIQDTNVNNVFIFYTQNVEIARFNESVLVQLHHDRRYSLSHSLVADRLTDHMHSFFFV